MKLSIFSDHPPVTPDTTDFMILGYTVIFGVMLLHLLSLYLRHRNLKLDLELLEDLEEE